ncbi:hypothetical protein [Halomonas sp. PA16-9]
MSTTTIVVIVVVIVAVLGIGFGGVLPFKRREQRVLRNSTLSI